MKNPFKKQKPAVRDRRKPTLKLVHSSEPEVLPPPPRIVPMCVKEAQEADEQRHILWLLENYPLRENTHLFPTTADVLTFNRN